MKKVCLALLTMLTLGMLCSCGGYVKNYSATILITSCQGDEASLAEGEMSVYIGVDGEKELLFIVKGGESYDETITLHNKYDNEKTIYIILESTGKCVDGDFEFEYN